MKLIVLPPDTEFVDCPYCKGVGVFHRYTDEQRNCDFCGGTGDVIAFTLYPESPSNFPPWGNWDAILDIKRD